MVRTKEIEIDGTKLKLTMLSKKDADQIERDYRVKYWLGKKSDMMEVIAQHTTPEQLAWAKAEYDIASTKFNDALSDSGFATVKKILRDNPIVTDDWLNEDEERYNHIQRACGSFRMDNQPIIERTVDLFINRMKEQSNVPMTGQEVITLFNDIMNNVSTNNDKKK
jgi:hypothetical protein